MNIGWWLAIICAPFLVVVMFGILNAGHRSDTPVPPEPRSHVDECRPMGIVRPLRPYDQSDETPPAA